MKKVILLLICLFFLWVLPSESGEPEWQEISRGIIGIKTVLFSSAKPGLIYVGGDKGVFKSEDFGQSWRNILKIKGDNRGVNYIALDSDNKQGLYVATDSGLYYSVNGDNSWKKVFKGKDHLQKDCSVVLSIPGAIFLGTRSGLFISKDNCRSWHKVFGKLGECSIFSISCVLKGQNYITVASAEGVFRSVDTGEKWKKIFISNTVGEAGETVAEVDDEEAVGESSRIRFLISDPINAKIYLATNLGVYYSQDLGEDWQYLSSQGLLSNDVQFLALSSNSELYASTKSSVFLHKGDTWRELSFKLPSSRINALGLDNLGRLYVCSEAGLFRAGIDNNITKSESVINEYSMNEPTIAQVQEAAINYAEVNPKKIKQWRQWAAQKAWLPELRIGLDRNSTDLWHWEGGSTTKACDDELRKGNDTLDWDVSLSWDLSELIWNNDQTSIDSRSKLMVELREDILDEVNKLYFERIRVKMEIDNLQIEDRKKRFDKELHIRELTASLDALTGGFFSHQTNG